MIRRAGGREDRVLVPVPPINRILRVMLHTRWSAEAWHQVKAELTKALSLGSQIRRAGCFD
jgi:histone H3/H4